MDLGIITTEEGGGGTGPDPFGIDIPKSQGGSGLLKLKRSGSSLQEESWRASKVPKANEFGIFSQAQSPSLLRSGSMIPTSNGQTMISFSSQSQAPLFPDEDAAKTSAIPFFLSPQESLSSRASGIC